MKKFMGLKIKQEISIIISISLVILPIQVRALPTGEKVISGSVSFDKTQQQMIINTSNKAIINYNSFDIDSNELVKFIQPNSSSVVLNRVILENPSSILGTLSANGKVFLVNPAGIYFGKNSIVNANSFLATTLDISNEDFLKGNYNFEQLKDKIGSYIIQNGTISVSDEGFVVLASPFISSKGAIIAKSGHVVLGATDNFSIGFDENGLINYDYKNDDKKSDSTVILSKDKAEDIVNDVINTDALDESIKIVKHGDKIELVGADDTVMVGSNINTDATKNAKAGKIEIKAKKKAFVLNKAKIHSNANALEGDGGVINIYSKDLTYADKGAEFSANAGLLKGNGGFLELSAKNKVIFGGSKVSLSSTNGKNGVFLIDPDEIEITNNTIQSGTDIYFVASKSINIDDNIILSTRDIGSSTDYLEADSVGDSGNVKLLAPTITLGKKSKVLTFANKDYKFGDIVFAAVANSGDAGNEAVSSITLNGAYLKGGQVDITATSTSSDLFDSVHENGKTVPQEVKLDFLDDPRLYFAAISDSKSTASINIGSGSTIDADNINILSSATSDSHILSVFTGTAIGIGKSQAKAYTIIEDGAVLNSKGDVNIQTQADSQNNVSVMAVGLGPARGSTVDVTLSYTNSDTTSNAVIENGAKVNAGGTLTVKADTNKIISSSATSGAYEDGTVGISAALSFSNSDTLSSLGGDISANNINVQATTNNNILRTSASSAVGTSFLMGKILPMVNKVGVDSLSKFISGKTPPSAGVETRKPALSAAVAYSDFKMTTQSNIVSNTYVDNEGSLKVEAINNYLIDPENGDKGLKTSSTATIDSDDTNKKSTSVAGALNITTLDSDVKAYIGAKSQIENDGDISLKAQTNMLYETTWTKINGVSDIMDYLNSNIGVQNGYFTTWAQSNSNGDVVGVAGSANYFHMKNNTESYVDNDVLINQDIDNRLVISAYNNIETVNIAGVFGMFFFGTSGKSAVGGSYEDVEYDNTAKTKINEGASIHTGFLNLYTKTSTNNISLAIAGTQAEDYAIGGAVSNIKINNITKSEIDSSKIYSDSSYANLTRYILDVDAIDDSKIFNVTGGVFNSKNVGIGASISLNDITRDTQSNINDLYFNNFGEGKVKEALVFAQNSGKIDAYSLSGSIITPFLISINPMKLFSKDEEQKPKKKDPGAYGIGVSGDVSINHINDTTKATVTKLSIKDNEKNKNLYFNIESKDDSGIDARAGSASIVTQGATSWGIAGSYTQNDIFTDTSSTLDNSYLDIKGLDIVSNNAESIESKTASGTLAASPGLSVAIAGSVSVNNINSNTKSQIINNSDITTIYGVSLSADDSSNIESLAGIVSLSKDTALGASYAKNAMESQTGSYIENSNLNSGAGISLVSTQNSKITTKAASFAAALSGMAASVSILENDIKNTVESGISSTTYDTDDTNNKKMVSKNDIDIKASDNENIKADGGAVGFTINSGVGGSILHNTMENTISSYVKNVDLDSGGSVSIEATGKKDISLNSLGGSAGTQLGVAGSLVVNKIEDSVSAYSDSSDIKAKKSLGILADEINTLNSNGGILNLGGVAGVGGTVVTNIIENDINAYATKSVLSAEGGDSLSSIEVDGTLKDYLFKGIDIAAYADEDIEILVGNLTGGGTASVGANVAVNILKDNVNSYVNDSTINEDNENANNDQDVKIRAGVNDKIDVFAGGSSFSSVAGAGASVNVNVIQNDTNAYAQNSDIKTKNFFQTISRSNNNINSFVVSGNFAGAVSLAGSVSVNNIENKNYAYIEDSTVDSEKDLDISAKNRTYLAKDHDDVEKDVGISVGSGSAGAIAGLGGSVIVNKIKQDTQAYAEDAKLNAKGKVSITADNYGVAVTKAVSGNLGVYAGAGGAVVLNTIDATAKAFTKAGGEDKMLINQDDNYKSDVQDVSIKSNNYSYIDSTPGVASASAVVGVSGSLDLSTIHSTSFAGTGDNTKINANRDLSIKASEVKEVHSNALAGAGAAIGVAGSVSIANINDKIDSDALTATDNAKSILGKMFTGSFIGDEAAYSDETDIVDQNTKDIKVDDEFDTDSSSSQQLIAKVGKYNDIKVGRNFTLLSSDTTKVDLLAGNAALGALSAGGSVSIANINGTQNYYSPSALVSALVDEGSNIQSGNILIEGDSYIKDNKVATIASHEGAVSLGAAVSNLNITSYNIVGVGRKVKLKSDKDIDIKSNSNHSSNQVISDGAQIGVAAVGTSSAALIQKGYVEAFGGIDSTLTSKKNITLESIYNIENTKAHSKASTGGIVSGSGSSSYISDKSIIQTQGGVNAEIDCSGDLTVNALVLASMDSVADGVSISGITVGSSQAQALWQPTIISVASTDKTSKAKNVYINALENYLLSNGGEAQTDNAIRAVANASGGSLIGGTSAISYAKRDTDISSNSYTQDSLEVDGDVIINTKSYGNVDSQANSKFYSLIGEGTTTSDAYNYAKVQGNLLGGGTLLAHHDIIMDIYGRSETNSNAIGGVGGILGKGGTEATSDVSNKVGCLVGGYKTKIYADNDINAKAFGRLYAKSKADIGSAGAVTKNTTKAQTTVKQDISTTVEEGSNINAKNVYIAAKAGYLKVYAEAYSETTSADSTSKAISDAQITSNTNVDVEAGASITGDESINIESTHYKDSLFISSIASAKIKAGFTGKLDSEANTNSYTNSNVNIDSKDDKKTVLTTNSLTVKAISPDKDDENTYNIEALTESNTVVKWVLKEVEELVEVSKYIPVVGWIVEKVSKIVEKKVKEYVNSCETSNATRYAQSDAKVTVNADIYLKSSPDKKVSIAKDGTITKSDGINAFIDNSGVINVDDLLNKDRGSMSLISSGDVSGDSDIYYNNAFSLVNIDNYSDKDLKINAIDTKSDDSADITVQNGQNSQNYFVYHMKSKDYYQPVNINNYGNGDIILSKYIINKGGKTNIFNQYGDILAQNEAYIKTQDLTLNAEKGNIGSSSNPIMVSLFRSYDENPTLSVNSFYDSYLKILEEEEVSGKKDETYMTGDIDIKDITTGGLLSLDLGSALVYYTYYDNNLLKNGVTKARSKYNIFNISSKKDISIDAKRGISLNIDGTVKSGITDLALNYDNDIASYSDEEKYLQSQSNTDVYLKDIKQSGGVVSINLTDGTIGGSGSIDMVTKDMHIDIKNLNGKTLHTSAIDTSAKQGSGFYINGEKQIDASGIKINELGYDKGQIDIENAQDNIKIAGDITNKNGLTTIYAGENIYDESQKIIDSDEINLQAKQDIGSSQNPVYVEGKISADAKNLYIKSLKDLLTDNIIAQNMVSLKSEGFIKSTDDSSKISSDEVELLAKGDIVASNDEKLKLSVNKLYAKSDESNIKISNDKDLVSKGISAKGDIEADIKGKFTQEEGSELKSQKDMKIVADNDVNIYHIDAGNRVTLISKDGAVKQSSDVKNSLTAKETVLKAKKGIELNTQISTLDAYNSGTNDITVSNQGSITLADLDNDGYALYNKGGDITLTSDSDILSSGQNSKIVATNLSLKAQGDIKSSDNKEFKTFVDTLSAKSDTADIKISNDKDLILRDISAKGDIFLDIKGKLTQDKNCKTVSIDKNVFVTSDGTFNIEYIKAHKKVIVTSKKGDLLGNLKNDTDRIYANDIILTALNGKVGTKLNPLYLNSQNSIALSAIDQKGVTAVYVYTNVLPYKITVGNSIALVNNKIIGGDSFKEYESIVSNLFEQFSAIPNNFAVTFLNNTFKPSDLIIDDRKTKR